MGRDLRDVYRSDRTCCLALPLFHRGIYSALALNLLFASFVGITAIAGPGGGSLVSRGGQWLTSRAKVPALVRPSAVSVVFAVSCFLIAAVHVARSDDPASALLRLTPTRSIWAVARNKHTLFQNLFGLSTVSVLGVLLFALVLIIVSAADHATSVRACLDPLVGTQDASPTLTKVCDVTLWIQTGIMFGSWFIVSVVECYLFLRQRVTPRHDSLSNRRSTEVRSQVYLTLKMEDAVEDAKL